MMPKINGLDSLQGVWMPSGWRWSVADSSKHPCGGDGCEGAPGGEPILDFKYGNTVFPISKLTPKKIAALSTKLGESAGFEAGVTATVRDLARLTNTKVPGIWPEKDKTK